MCARAQGGAAVARRKCGRAGGYVRLPGSAGGASGPRRRCGRARRAERGDGVQGCRPAADRRLRSGR